MKGLVASSASKNFQNLTKNKNLVLLTRAQVGKKVQASFFHSTIGIPIIPEDLHYTARIGMKMGLGIEVDPATLFKSSDAIKRPDLKDLMKVKTVDEFKNLEPIDAKVARKTKCYALLTPSLSSALLPTNMPIPQVYLAIVERIRAKMGDQTGEDADEMLQRVGEPYDYVLYFLWACYHAEDKIYAPNLSILDAPETQNWEKSTRDEIFPKKSTPQVVDLSTSSIHQGLPSGTITAITKLSDTMIAHQEAALKNQEEKADSRDRKSVV